MGRQFPAPCLVLGFEGISFNDTFCGCLPPDGAFAAGPNHLIGAVNTAYKVWNKSGQLLLGPTDIGLFFLGCNMGGVSDPFVDYDASTDRFVLGILSYDFLYNSAVCIAVSRTGDPTGQWYVYYVPVTASDGSGDLFDFPHLAIGSDAFYVAGNQFTNQAQTYAGPRVFAWNKAQMYAGQAQAAGVHFDIPDVTKDTLWPARGVGVAKVMYFAAVDNNCPCANAHVWKWTDPFGANSFVYQGAAPLLAYDQPPSALQPGGGLITTNDTRNLAAYWSNASGTPTVFGAHTIACNPGTGTVACVHWFQLGNLDGPPVTVAQATIGAAGQYRFYPNLAVNKTGDVTVGFAYSSATEYAGVHVYDLGTAVETAPRPGEANVDGSRYGDYAGTTVDPDGCTILALRGVCQERHQVGYLGYVREVHQLQRRSGTDPDTDGDADEYARPESDAPSERNTHGNPHTFADGHAEVSTRQQRRGNC